MLLATEPFLQAQFTSLIELHPYSVTDYDRMVNRKPCATAEPQSLFHHRKIENIPPCKALTDLDPFILTLWEAVDS